MLKITEPDLKDTLWGWHSGGSIRFAAEGVASHTRWKNTGTWKVEKDGTATLKDAKGLTFRITFLSDQTARVKCLKGGSTTIKRLAEKK